MKMLSSRKSRLTAGLGLAAVAAALCLASTGRVRGQDSKAAEAATTNTPPAAANAKPAKPGQTVEKKKLTGAELYAINCNRCHSERYPTEFTSAQWQTIMLHMRVRANLPADQAKEILKYLQEDSGK